MPNSNDLARVVTVTVAEVLCLLGSMLGSGVFGGPTVSEAAGGALSADATLLAPAGPAFTIWTLIYVGLAAYTLWQWLPEQRTAERHRAVGWWIAASMLLNAAWLLVVRQGWLWLSVVVIAVLVLVLGYVVATLARNPSGRTLDTVITDGTMGVYTGWVCVAVCANVTATLVDAGVDPGAPWDVIAAVAVLVLAGLVGAVVLRATRANLGVGLALAWGVAWIAVERLRGEPESVGTAVAAIVVAVAVLVITALARTTRTVRT